MKSTRARSLSAAGLAVAIAASLLTASPAVAGPDDPVDVPDVGLQQCLSVNAGVSVRTEASMAAIKQLVCDDTRYAIRSLEGLQYATGLTSLYVQNQDVGVITPITSLTSLTTLQLDGNRIINVSGLANLPNLALLSLADNNVSDVSALAGLTNLHDVNVSRNHLTDISAFVGVTKDRLSAVDQIITLPDAVLGKPTNIGFVDADGGRLLIRRVTGNLNAANTELTYVDAALVGTRQTLLLGQFPTNNLTITASQNVVRDLGTPVALGNPELEACLAEQLNGDPITDVTLAQVTTLSCDKASVPSSLSGVEKMTNLETLSLSGGDISDISPLTGLTKLATVDLSDNLVEDLSPLATTPALTEVDLAGNEVVDVTALAAASRLVSVDVSENHVSDLSSLSGLNTTVTAVDQTIELADAVVGEPFAFLLRDARKMAPTVTAASAGITYDGRSLLYNLDSLAGSTQTLTFDSGSSFSGVVRQRVVSAKLVVAGEAKLTRAPSSSAALRGENALATTGAASDAAVLAFAALSVLLGAALVSRRRRA